MKALSMIARIRQTSGGLVFVEPLEWPDGSAQCVYRIESCVKACRDIATKELDARLRTYLVPEEMP